MIAPDRLSAVEIALLALCALVGRAAQGSPPEASADPRCVDAGRYEASREIVEDREGGRLLWQRRISARLSQPEAARYCAGLSLDDVDGWRLPSPVELESIRYLPGGLFGDGSTRHYCIPSIDQAAFPETPAALFWTSRLGPDDTAWYVGFDDGRSHRDAQGDALWVRCVHDALPPAPN
jgi:hypothetical protein